MSDDNTSQAGNIKEQPATQQSTNNQSVFSEKGKTEIKEIVDQEINDKLKIKDDERKKQKDATKCKTIGLAVLIFIIIGLGIIGAFISNQFAFVPFGVVLAGIVAFFGIMIISNQLADKDDINSGEMRRAIAVAIVVVYLGLLPTLAFQGILQYQVLGLNETPTSNVTFNESSNITTTETTPAAPLPIELSQTAISSFTALVTAVILSYFGLRTWKEVEEIKNSKDDESKKG